jgi:3-oxoacyl-[acyl-carrier protein] reductase
VGTHSFEAGMILAGKTALVTGASRGIGKAIALALAEAGASVMVTGRTAASAEAAESALRKPGRKVVGIACDLAERGAAQALVSAANRALGQVDVLVNNAGTLHHASVVETSPAQFRRVIDVNLNAPFELIRGLVPGMVERRYGRIINISSISGTLGTARLSSYCASKWGLNGLTKALAAELKGTGVLAAAVMPGSVDTDMLKSVGFPPEIRPEEIAQVVKFLCSEAPVAMQGSLVEVFG